MDWPIPYQRQRGRRQQPEAARGYLGPRDIILYQNDSRVPVANQVFLGSWTADICQEGRSQRSHGTTEIMLPLCNQEIKWLESGR